MRNRFLVHVVVAVFVWSAWILGLFAWGRPLAVSFACVLLSLAAMRWTSRSGFRVFWFNAALVVLVLGSAIWLDYANQRKKFDSRIDPTVGRNTTQRETLRHDGRVVYDVSYTVRPSGFRVRLPSVADESEECVLLFGCSFAFGQGVNDADTLSHQIEVQSSGKYKAHNFGVSGTGPHHMLGWIREGALERFVDCAPKFVLYEAIHDHVARAYGRPTAAGDPFGPRFSLSAQGKLERRGNFFRFYASGLGQYRLIASLRWWIERWFYPPLGSQDLELTVRIIDEARRELAERYPEAEFHMLHWDRDASWPSRPSGLGAQARRRGIKVHLVSDILPHRDDWVGEYQIPHDLHPSAKANERIADYLVTKAF